MNTRSVLIIEMSRQALATVRSLGRAGYHVIVGRCGADSAVEHSRFCHEVWDHPEIGSSAFFEQALTTFLDSRPDIQVIYPTGENSTQALGSMPSILERDITRVMVHPPLLNDCLNKTQAMALAKNLDINLPASQEVRSNIELWAAVDAIGFPIIVKPVRSTKKLFERKAYIIRSSNELESVFANWPAEHSILLAQQYIEGDIEACDFVASNGKMLGYMEALTVRTDIPDGTGFCVDFTSIPVSSDLYSACQQFAQAQAYTGPGLMQCIRSKTDNLLYFVEINPRLAAGISHTIACGQNFPLLALQAFSPAEADRLPEFCDLTNPYKSQQSAHWLEGDIVGLLAERHRLTLQQKLTWCRQMLASFFRAESHMNWQWSDPKPSLVIYSKLLFRFTKPIRKLLTIARSGKPR